MLLRSCLVYFQHGGGSETAVNQTQLDRVDVPDEAFIIYRANTLRIVLSDGEVLFVFKNISRLFFWTGFNGTRIFVTTAFVPFEEIFGGGACRK